MIKKVLVANRGEIACRIIKTLSKLGIESSVVFSKEDEGSLAVKMADKSFLLKDPENKSQEYSFRRKRLFNSTAESKDNRRMP